MEGALFYGEYHQRQMCRVAPCVPVRLRVLCYCFLDPSGVYFTQVYGQETGGKMTAAEIYESMDECMKRYRGMDFDVVLRAVRAHAAVLGRSAGRTEDEILGFYFKMRHLGDH